MGNDPMMEIAYQMSIQNRVTILTNLYKLQCIDPEEYIDRLKDIFDEMR